MASRPALTAVPAAISRYHELALLAMLASGFGAVLASGAMDMASAVLAGAAMIARAGMVAGWFTLALPPIWVNAATLGYIAFYPLDWRFVSRDFLTATVHLVFFVAAIKLLTAETSRDYLLLKVVALLEILAAALLSAGLMFLLFLALFMVAATAALASGEIRNSVRTARVVHSAARRTGRRLSALTAVSACAMLVLTALFFLVLPRTARAALSWFIPSQSRVSGFGSEVVLGQAGEIRRSTEVVLHFRFREGVRPVDLHWRGTALAEFNGWKWYNTAMEAKPLLPGDDGLLRLAGDDLRRLRQGPRLNYQVILERTHSDWLFLAGSPEFIRLRPARVIASPNGALRVPFALGDRLQYDVIAWPEQTTPGPLSQAERIFHLRLPQTDSRVLKLAGEITASARTDLERARAIESWLQANLQYSLDPWEKMADDPVAHFLCVRKKGHCEYFASAMAVMLRAVWVPSRVVTGYLGGAQNPLVDWQVVRASDAHSWVEAYIPGSGWVTFDPTPAAGTPLTGLSRLAIWMDAAQLLWQDWIVGYDLDRQLSLALSVGESRKRFSLRWPTALWDAAKAELATLRTQGRTLPAIGASLLALAVLAASPRLARWASRAARRRRAARGRLSGGDASLFYQQMLEILSRKGLLKMSWQTPAEFAASIPDRQLGDAVFEFTRAYYDARFGALPTGATRLGPLLDRIRSLP